MANRRGLCLNPRGTLWANDQNKYGQKMLEKMGWKLGQGLGVREDGAVDPIRIPYKNDTKGLGCVVCPDPWLNNQENFNDLLSQLNGNVQDCPEAPLVSSSLTEKSKNSRKRVHYHKFARSKDLSCRSLEELASVLGDKRLMQISLKKGVQMDSDTDAVVQKNSEDEEDDERQRRKNKRRKKKLKRDKERNVSMNEEKSSCEESNEEESFIGDAEQIASVSVKKSKKKARQENLPVNEKLSELESEEELDSSGDRSNKKSVKKRKCNNKIENGADLESTVEETKCSSKRKKPKKQKRDLVESVESDESEVETEQCESEVQKQQNLLENDTDSSIVESCKNRDINWDGMKLFKGSNLLILRGYGNDVSSNGN